MTKFGCFVDKGLCTGIRFTTPSIKKFFFTTLQHHISSKKNLVDLSTLVKKILKKIMLLDKSRGIEKNGLNFLKIQANKLPI